jgi:hypothetical protein
LWADHGFPCGSCGSKTYHVDMLLVKLKFLCPFFDSVARHGCH